MSVRTVRRPRAATLAGDIADRLRTRITTGTMPPGSRLIESQLSREYGISRAPIREAARLLEREGLLTFNPNKGFTIRELTLKELSDVFDVRICIERHAAQLAAANRRKEFASELTQRYRDILSASRRGDRDGEREADFAFHHAIVQFTGNARLLRIFDDAAAEMRLILSLVGEVAAESTIAESHEPVLRAILDGQPEEATQAMEAHIRLYWDEVIQKIASNDDLVLPRLKGPPPR